MAENKEFATDLVRQMFHGTLGLGRTVTATFAEANLPPEKRNRYAAQLLGLAPPKPKDQPPADPDLAAAEALIADVSAQLEPEDLEALRAAPRETKLYFAKRLTNQRELKADDEARAQAAADAAVAAERQREHERLAGLGFAVGRSERGK
jgi:hypothetical protein